MAPTKNEDVQLQSERDCKEHNFTFMRSEAKEYLPGQWHGDMNIVDIFYCSKCLAYKEVVKKRLKYDEYIFSDWCKK